MTEHDDLDKLLSEAMQARRWPDAVAGLAQRVMAGAQEREGEIELRRRAMSLRRWSLVIEGVAAFAVVCLLVVIMGPMLGQEAGVTADGPVAMEVADAGDAADTVSEQVDLELICGGLLLGALLFIVIERAMAAPRSLHIGRVALTG